MNKNLQIKLNQISETYSELQKQLSSPSISNEERISLSKKFSSLEQIIKKKKEVKKIEVDLSQTEELLNEAQDSELEELAREDIASLKKSLEIENNNLKKLLIPKDIDDERNAIVEIRAGTGGDEAALFSMVLLRMYQKYGEINKWKYELLNFQETNIGGCKEAILSFTGKNVFSSLKYESGVHRVQRVPQTETQGRIHTSTATVAVMPEAEDVDVQLKPDELNIQATRSGGPGGQHVNTTDSCIQVTHLPTGIMVRCQDGRSQTKNKEKALTILRSKLLEAKQREEAAKYSEKRRNLIGSGGREEKIRTYNFPQNRVTDHRIGLTLHNLEGVLTGQIDELVDGLQASEMAERLEEAGLK